MRKVTNEQLEKDVFTIATYKAQGITVQECLKRIDALLMVKYQMYDYIVTPVIKDMDLLDIALGRKLEAYTYLEFKDEVVKENDTTYLITLFERETEGKSCYHQKNTRQN